jgi:hypothetical protein
MKRYRTEFEATTAMRLIRRNISFEYEPARLRYTDKNGRKRITQPDFHLKPKSNDPHGGMFVEAKSLLKNDHLSRYELLREQRPDLDIRFIFEQPDRTISHFGVADGEGQTRAVSYSEWADMNGFKWSGEAIPNALLNELKKK